ncbi:hypothetical protein M9H77_24298 [Catharanthus roseus]|uniref:Uncharacterized protein n=1 Tax=Catharanthus roseus TaxID=4058 RepID=A0ACC0AVS4_CATRO|nr:hypothetical protein M9H77_24298 [Catharanthus roseus]
MFARTACPRSQAHLDVDYSHQQECTAEKKLVMEQIGCNSGSAASVVCNILQSIDTHDVNCEFASNVLGVVAILGTVQTNNLSRILAKYLGEDQMLAIVCKSTKYASDLVKHGPNGQINSDVGLHALATKLGLPINKQYVVISLENTRAYAGEISNNHLRKLALPDPILANGSPPPGYLGYAVNMIELDSSFWHWKTPSGHSLRETLFYHLFGDLQVYENREAMNRATYCIMHAGAVSLDGGAMKHGVVTIGNW